MRIGIDARFIDERFIGVGRYSYALIREIAKIDSVNEYIIFKNRNYKDNIVSQANFKEVPIACNPISFGTWFYLSKVFYKEKLDILHSHFYITPLLYSYKSIVTVHDFHALVVKDFLSQRPYLIEKGAYLFHLIGIYLSIKRANKIIFVSEAARRDAFNLYKSIPSNCVIYEGVEEHFQPVKSPNALDRIREKYCLPNEFFLYIGNTKPHKNLHTMLKSYRRLLDIEPSIKNIHFVLAGKKDRFFPKIQTIIKELRLTEKICLIDYIADADMPAVYSASKAFIFLSIREGFGLPALEAMACGAPVIAANAASLPEVVADAGILVEPFDVEGIAQKMRELIINQSLRDSLSKNGVRRAREFSWRKAAKETLKVYEEVYRKESK